MNIWSYVIVASGVFVGVVVFWPVLLLVAFCLFAYWWDSRR